MNAAVVGIYIDYIALLMQHTDTYFTPAESR